MPYYRQNTSLLMQSNIPHVSLIAAYIFDAEDHNSTASCEKLNWSSLPSLETKKGRKKSGV